MSKHILWLDDQFTKLHEHFLYDYVEAFTGKAKLHRCNRLSQFAEMLANRPFHGIILDVMLRRERNVINYEALEQPKIPYRAEQAGIDIARIIRGIDNIPIKNRYQETQKLPILLLTGESDDPEEQYHKEHPKLFEHIKSDNPPLLWVHSKGEPNIRMILQEWLEIL